MITGAIDMAAMTTHGNQRWNCYSMREGIVKDIFEMFSRLTGISLQRESDQNFAGITGAHQSKLTNERKWAVHAEDGPKKRNWKIFNIMQFAQSCSKLLLQTSVFER